jgi:TPR repeat protein
MYYSGQGVKEENAQAAGWFRKAADQGNADAQFSLGSMYYSGQGVKKDDTETLRWWRKAAAQGEAHAQYDLGLMYARGEGMPQDYVRAHMWFNLAAANGNAAAVSSRDVVAGKMTRAQIAEAQRLAREWKPKTRVSPTRSQNPHE